MDGALVASSSPSSTAPTNTGKWTYDVFLSFRGEDTRNNFVDHLYAALDQAGIYTFKDDEKLQRGKSISPELMKAIEESTVSVVVFSKNYANSCWCLEELVKIMECWDKMGQRVLPVFYDVDPSDVRGQKGSFLTAFRQHEEKFEDDLEKVKRWREALKTTANLSGWDVPRIENGREAECIKKIVRTTLSYNESRPQENLIGMESRIRHVKTLLCIGVDNVCFIGIWGMGGIGKTTIARAVYRQISYVFEGSSFLVDVRENGSDERGLQSLQEKLLSEILMQDHFSVRDCDDGMCQIKRRLSRKKVLIVFDDVDNIKQLQFLAGDRDWFGPGSRIMITTRDEHLLCYAQEKYPPELLNETEAMKLFSTYAFMKNSPPKEFEELSRDVVSHTGHLPLALKVLGSHFRSRNLDFWKSALKTMAKIPHNEINGVLKLSYDGLNILEKKIFLHIACLYKGMDRHHVTRNLDALGFEAASGITVLIEKSLLSILYGDLHMHDLIQDMGQCIVQECYPNTMARVPEEMGIMEKISGYRWRSLLASCLLCFGHFYSLICEVDYKRLEVVEAIVEPLNSDRFITCSAGLLKSMKKLKLLDVRWRFTSGEPTYFPQQLRCLSWTEYPFDCLRITRDLTNLVGLNIPNGLISQLQIEKKAIFPNLKFINLQDSESLTMFPSVLGMTNLERVNLSSCEKLVEVHECVFLHEKIIYLNLSLCVSLENLPTCMSMKSLQALFLRGCRDLKSFPEVSTDMPRLSLLNIDFCYSVRALPSSIRLLTGLTTLVMGECFREADKSALPNLLIQGSLNLSCLRVLDLSNNFLDDSFPHDLHTAWPSLEEYDLSGNMFTCMPPATISQLSHLKHLDLRHCVHLTELPELPPRIQVLKADGCKSLQKIGDLSNMYKWLFKISLCECPKLVNDRESQHHIANLLMKSLVQKCAAVNHRLSIMVPGSKIPNWFSNQRVGNKIQLYLPHNQVSQVIGLAICCCKIEILGMYSTLKIKFEPSVEGNLIGSPAHLTESVDGTWVGYMPVDILRNVCRGFEYENLIISFENYDGFESELFGVKVCNVVKCGVCVVYKDDINPMTGTGSWISDYDELGRINNESEASEALLHGRWSSPIFSFDHWNTRDHNSVEVML